MAGLDEGTVDFRPTYNGEEEEPEVFPGLFPNLLANGASGIAVGMATSIPPHNVAELIDAAIASDRQSRRPSDAALMDFVAGPDFPTGGVLVDRRGGDRRGLCDRPRQLPGAGALDRSRTREGRRLASAWSARSPTGCPRAS